MEQPPLVLQYCLESQTPHSIHTLLQALLSVCGCRSFVIPIARAAGSLKRLDPESSEEVILYRTMLDLIKPKLVYLDLPLFMALLSDLFPGVELAAIEGGLLRAAVEQDLRESGLQVGWQGWPRPQHNEALC